MAKEIFEFKEAVTLFLSNTLRELHNNQEIPAINIVFTEPAFVLFEYVKNNPATKENSYIPPLYDKDIENAKIENNNKKDRLSITIHDPIKFFELLTEYINSLVELRGKHWGSASPRHLFLTGVKRLFLRMSPNDFNNIEAFLEKQVDFLKNDTLDDFIKENKVVDEFYGYELCASNEETMNWCETDMKMTFMLRGEDIDYDLGEGTIMRSKEKHTLPSIYFGIREEDGKPVCYIYAIQNERHRVESKKMRRSLYKLNSGDIEPNVDPASILALSAFIDILNSRGITKIKVPGLQVLSYDYHRILSETTKKDMQERYSPEKLEYINNLSSYEREKELEEYEWFKMWYEHTVDKQDFISKAKTKGLFDIFRRVSNQFGTIELLNTPFIEDENLNVNISNQRVLK